MKQRNVVPARLVPGVVSMSRKPAVVVGTRTESDAAELMWAYYKDRKALFVADIRLHRASILAALMVGIPAEAALDPFLRPAAAKRERRAA
jgi:hypothetical protein